MPGQQRHDHILNDNLEKKKEKGLLTFYLRHSTYVGQSAFLIYELIRNKLIIFRLSLIIHSVRVSVFGIN